MIGFDSEKLQETLLDLQRSQERKSITDRECCNS